ncbi:hypothetical protein CC78DRAFT_529673 [Lojkania enalia]|uniref:Uncharacterized protein n=1 Tax=Lojkania enalia TaxID=147567 RepID=A0A9P4KGE4_9PLEO|nr:hypothetical protein CC78DRAFT_529673 [Didymosphaeria enalia]
MATAAAGPTLMTIPLELRHAIFEQTTVSEKEPKKMFRYWFEKKELAQLAAAHNNPGVMVAHNSEDDTDNEGEAEEEDEDLDDAEVEDDDAEVEDEEHMDREEGDEDLEDGDGDSNTQNVATMTATATQTAPRTPVLYTHRKWRHIPNFIRITHCPPPLELLLTSKDLSREARDWFYDVAILKIDATASFAHTSFFEESLNDIADAAFSPVESIRRVEVKFVWDTAWLRASDAIEEIYQAMCRQRAWCVSAILQRAPSLKELKIIWHDSAQDGAATAFKADIFENFWGLFANIAVEEHYLSDGETPHSNTPAGKQRLEFEEILASGRDYF